MKMVVDFGPIHVNVYTIAAALATLVYVPMINTNKTVMLSKHIAL